MATIIATPGASNANSYLTLAEATTYYSTRLFTDNWDNSDDQTVALIMATRVLDYMAVAHRRLVRMDKVSYYITDPAWTGAPATSTQALAWPRTGMYDRLGRAILSTVIPQELKDATAELAGQLSKADRTLDNDVIVQGLKSVKAGSVALEFNEYIQTYVIPDAVWALMPDSWFTDELIEPALTAEFELL
jgi:hypothetical protein